MTDKPDKAEAEAKSNPGGPVSAHEPVSATQPIKTTPDDESEDKDSKKGSTEDTVTNDSAELKAAKVENNSANGPAPGPVSAHEPRTSELAQSTGGITGGNAKSETVTTGKDAHSIDKDK